MPTYAKSAFVMAVFVLTGWCVAVNVQVIRYYNMDDMGLVAFAFGMGNLLVIFLDHEPLNDTAKLKKMALAGTSDAISNLIFALSLILAGSMYHTVVYASLPIWVVVARRFALQETISTIKFISICFSVGGLLLVFNAGKTDSDAERNHAGADSNLLLGIALSVVCVAVMACNYTLQEWAQKSSNAPSDYQLTWAGGLMGVLTAGCVMAINSRHILAQVTESTSSGFQWCLFLYVTAMGATGIHMITWYWLCRYSEDGSVLLGVLQGVRTVVVVIHGAMYLCQHQQSQCITRSKLTALAVVAAGVTLYLSANKLQHTCFPESRWLLHRKRNSQDV